MGEEQFEAVLDEYKCPSCFGNIYLRTSLVEVHKEEFKMFFPLKDLLTRVAKIHGVTYTSVEKSLRSLIDRWHPTLVEHGLFDERPTTSKLINKFYLLAEEESKLHESDYENEDMRYSVYPIVFGNPNKYRRHSTKYKYNP